MTALHCFCIGARGSTRNGDHIAARRVEIGKQPWGDAAVVKLTICVAIRHQSVLSADLPRNSGAWQATVFRNQLGIHKQKCSEERHDRERGADTRPLHDYIVRLRSRFWSGLR
jgi:hypothetical protein